MGRIKAASAVITQAKPAIEPYLDEYGITADFLREQGVPQYDVVADALMDMRNRILSFFLDESMWSGTPGVIVRDGWAYATDSRVFIRVRTSEPDTEISKKSPEGRWFKTANRYIDEWDARQDGDVWRQWPSDFTFETDDPWEATVAAAERRIALPLAQRINMLPNVEYLDDTGDYIGAHGNEPLQFRFRCGQGFVMPILGAK